VVMGARHKSLLDCAGVAMLVLPREADCSLALLPVRRMTDPIGPIRQAIAGRYEIEREIGQGAFATVYLARDLRHDRYVAFKILNADPSSETSELRFLREIRMLASLQHPNISSADRLRSRRGDALLRNALRDWGIAARSDFARSGNSPLRPQSQCARGVGCARVRPSEGNHSSRHQTREHPALGRASGDCRFRHRARNRSCGRSSAHANGCRQSGHAGLHES